MSAPAPGPKPTITKSIFVSIREAGITEAVIEKIIAEDTSLLHLGEDVVLIERQRQHEKAGRLDLLLEDKEEGIRYEVELMLGKLDETHLVRTVEYWDIERRRYPGYDHRAVIIAEDITSRFLNVIHLFSGSIPIIAIQVNCLRVADLTTLTFIRVLDSTEMRTDDSPEVLGKGADRIYWVNKVGQPIISLIDECAAVINEFAKSKRTLNYNKQYIGLADGGAANNFVYFRPKKTFIGIRARLESKDQWVSRLEAEGLDVSIKKDRLRLDVSQDTFAQHKVVIRELLKAAIKEEES